MGLLQGVAERPGSTPPQKFDSKTVAWIIETGLGPILWAAYRQQPDSVPPACHDPLRAADLTALFLSTAMFDALGTILDGAATLGCAVTLVKGASVAGQWYPEPHWRPMRDIDLLVDAREQSRFEQLLRDLGFQQQSWLPEAFFLDHHHSMPFYHPQWRCWVEVHRGLFRDDRPERRIAALRPEALAARRQACTVRGASAWRLADPEQLVYTAVHWGGRLTLVGGLVPLLDMLLMLRRGGEQLDWDAVLDIAADEAAARPLFVALDYLRKQGLIELPAAVWRGLARGHDGIGRGGVRMLHGIIDDFMVCGKRQRGLNSEALVNMRWETLLGEGPVWRKRRDIYWRTLFPLAENGRYSPRRQLQRLRNQWR
ncbi:MAG: nucleotidyltransferase family protein [Gammaproteobacteria bacterium]